VPPAQREAFDAPWPTACAPRALPSALAELAVCSAIPELAGRPAEDPPPLTLPLRLVSPPPLPSPAAAAAAASAAEAECARPRMLSAASYARHFALLLDAEDRHARCESCRADRRDLAAGTLRIELVPRGDAQRAADDAARWARVAEKSRGMRCVLEALDCDAAGSAQRAIATLSVPGVSEGHPRLERGAIVRLRTEGAASLLGAACLPGLPQLEIEATVVNVVLARDEVLLELPSRLAIRACLACSWDASAAKAAAAASAAAAAPAAASGAEGGADWLVYPATRIALPCGHQVLCDLHAALEGIRCPACFAPVASTVDVVGRGGGWALDALPPHLAVFDASARRGVPLWRAPSAAEHDGPDGAFLNDTAKTLLVPQGTVRAVRVALTLHGRLWLELLRGVRFSVRFEVERAFSRFVRRNVDEVGELLAARLAPNMIVYDEASVRRALATARDVRAGQARGTVENGGDSLSSPSGIGSLEALTAFLCGNGAGKLQPISSPVEAALFPTIRDVVYSLDEAEVGRRRTSSLESTLRLLAVAKINELLLAGVPVITHENAPRLQLDAAVAAELDAAERAQALDVLNVRADAKAEAHALSLARTFGLERMSALCAPALEDAVCNDLVTRILRPLALPVSTFFAKGLNATQMAAVEAIVSGSHGRIPFLLLGPAGTGKSSVLIEVVLQLLIRCDELRRDCNGSSLLLVAPSNEAADLLLAALDERFSTALAAARLLPAAYLQERLEGGAATEDGVAGILRLNAPSRPVDTMRSSLLPYSLATSAGMFTLPAPATAARCRLVVCHTAAVALLPSLGLCPGFFAQVICDEASQATEPEALLALRALGDATRTVLAGDTRQLGATVTSEVARRCGLATSLQERLHSEVVLARSCRASVVGASAALENAFSDALASSGLRSGGEGDVAMSVYEALPRLLFSGEFVALHASSAAGDHLSRGFIEQRQRKLENAAGPVRAVEAGAIALSLAEGGKSGEAGSIASSLSQVLRSSVGFIAAHALTTTLTVNYRSSQELLDLPSRLFYSSAPLVSEASGEETQTALKWSLLRSATEADQPPYPVLAVGVRGRDERISTVADSESVSYANRDEADAIVFVVRSLLSESTYGNVPAPDYALVTAAPEQAGVRSKTEGAKLMHLTANDIAVIAPFRQQVLLVRRCLRDAGLASVNVGSELNLQGAQRPVVIVCTVLSQMHGVRLVQEQPRRRALLQRTFGETRSGAEPAPLPNAVGLFYNPKALNVSLTRAQSLTVVVGDPRVWELDPHFREVLYTCVDHRAWRGFQGCTLDERIQPRDRAALGF